MKEVTLPGIVSDNTNKKFKEGELSFDLPDDSIVNGFGRYISKDVANVLISAFRKYLESHNDKQPYAVTFGKEAILSILAQKDCEGIRFYFGKRSKDQWGEKSKYADKEGITLVAVGVDEKNKDLSTGGGYIIDPPKKGKTVKTATSTRIVEVVPPEP
jgi:hypothetical protein